MDLKIEDPTEEDFKKEVERLKKRDPLFDLRVEHGKLLMINIDDLTEEQHKRYLVLKEYLEN